MAQNVMKAKPALPERVRSMEGLERILSLAAPGVHEASPGFGRDVWVNRVPLKAAFAAKARLFERALGRSVLGVAGSLNSKGV